MHFQFIVAPPTPALSPPAPPTAESQTELLKAMLDLQRQQLEVMRAAANNEAGAAARWRNFFSRWKDEFGHLPDDLRQALPKIERAFLTLVDNLVAHLRDEEGGDVDDDYSLGEFLDRYAMRAAQLGSVLNLLGQMAEATRAED